MKITKTIGALLAAAALIFGAAGFISCSDGNGGSSSSDPTVNKNGDGTTTITIDDNQKGYISGTGSLGTGKTGWNATNDSFWENFRSAGDANIKYCVNTDTAGEYTMVLRYCFGGNCDVLRDVTVSINGKTVASENEGNIFYIDYTANKKWTNKEIPVNLDVGDNFIVIKCAYGTKRNFTIPDISGISYGSIPAEKRKPGEVVECTVQSMPNIDWISITSKAQNVKMSAGSANATAYWNLTASSMNENYGTITVSPVQESYTNGTEVTVTATPADGYSFDSWNGSTKSGWISSNEATFKLVITSDVTLNARFIPSTFDKATELKGLEGYAAICDDKGTAYTVTGGFGGETITLASVADIDANKAKISGNDPYIIKVAARITTTDNKSLAFDVGSNKTLIGEAGKDFGFKNINPKISGENVIVKNLHFGDVIGDDLWGGAGNDALSIKGGKHIWIDHCEFSSSIDPKNNDGTPLSFAAYKEAGGQVDLEGESTDPETKWKKDFYDGLLDVSELSRFVSVSNCYFHDHWKACLCGGSNDKEEQRANGSLVRLSMYNNYFNNIHARQPLFRFGKAHIYSSYLYGADDASGIEARAKSEVYVDNVCFENIKSGKEVGYWNTSSGDIGSGSWKVVDCEGASGNSGSVATPPYTWTKTSASDSKANLPSSVGIEK